MSANRAGQARGAGRRRAGRWSGRPRRAQLRIQVLVGVVLVTLVALAAFDLAAVTALHGYLLARTDGQLRTVQGQYRAQGVAQSAPLPFGVPRQVVLRGRPVGPAPKSSWTKTVVGPHLVLPGTLGQYYVVWVSPHGSRVFVHGNPALVPLLPPNLAALAAGRRAQTVASVFGGDLRLQAVSEAGGSLVVTTSLATVNSTTTRLALIVIAGSVAAAMLVFVGVAWVVRRGLRPIETMAAQADRITAGDLTDRVHPDDSATEVGRLGAALNGMLTRIEAALHEREASQELTRRFFADASHELRTPLASLRANAELYQQGALPQRAQVDEAMRRIVLEAQRMSALVDDMLRLARLDHHPEQRYAEVDLTALISECAERARIADPARTWLADIEPGLTVTGDEELLHRAVGNLLANVAAHTPATAVGTITAAGCASTVTIDVSDDGPGVPAAQLPRIFDRFYRPPAPSRRPGSGLGLAIVTAVAAAHHGTATATLNQPHGLRVTLALPTSPQPGQPALTAAAASANGAGPAP
ncbi:MAG TPA: ATP-binding protein [Streptosporangiaceae bacterium]|jgi:two-component system OmpR family sensor kinase|nr:ATP-binding protein [Streptosporangiaceae bacterium]